MCVDGHTRSCVVQCQLFVPGYIIHDDYYIRASFSSLIAIASHHTRAELELRKLF